MHNAPRLLLAALPLLTLPAFAQHDTTRIPLDTVRVMATRIASPLPRIGRHLQVLDTTQLRHAPRPEISEVLRTSTLVDVRQRGPFDAQTDLGIRGGTFDQALVLVDGIPMTDPQTGHHLMDIPLLTDAVERVEVLYGGASRTFGGGAFSGALNIITREPQGTRGGLTLEGGSYGSYRLRVSQDVAGERGGIRISAFHSHTDGYVEDSDHDMTGAHIGLTHRFGRIKLKAQLSGIHKRFGAQNYYSSLYPDQQEITGTYLGALELRNDDAPWRWNVRAYHRRHDDLFQLFREGDGWYRYADGYFVRDGADTARFGPTSFYTYHNRHRTSVSGAEVNLQRTWKGGTTAIGAHARHEGILSNVLGVPLDEPITSPGAREDFTRSDERNNLAVHMDHRYERGRFGIDAGVLLNVNSAFTPQWAPGADLFFRWNAKHTTYASVGRSFRFPTYTDLYYNRGGAQGSIDLMPEHADQLELGHRVQAGRWRGSLCVWRRDGSDLIDWVVLPGETTARARNITEVDLNGVEAEIAYVTRNERGRGGVLYAHQWADQTSFPFTSLYVLDHLRDNVTLWWNQRITKAFTAQVNATWRTREGTYVRFTDGQRLPYPDPLRLDLRVDWHHGRFGLFASVANLLDAEQVDRGNVPLPGRWLSGGLQVRWGKE